MGLLHDPGLELGASSGFDPARDLFPRQIEPEDERRASPLRRPEPVALRAKRATRVGKLERPDHTPAVVRVDGRGRGGIPLGEDCVRSLRAETLVQTLEMGAHPGLGRRRQLEVGEGGTEV